MALSDGATSAKFAREAAIATVNGIIQYFEEHTLREFLCLGEEIQKRILLDYIIKCLIILAKKSGCSDPREFSATMLFFVSDEKNIICGHVGDGAIFITDRANKIILVSGPENENGISNKTFFPVSLNAIDHFRVNQINIQETSASQALMTSDGAFLMFYNRGNHDPANTAKEILGYVNTGVVSSNNDLKDALTQMAEVPSERLDDWSILIYSQKKLHSESCLKQVSMLTEELQKVSIIKKDKADEN